MEDDDLDSEEFDDDKKESLSKFHAEEDKKAPTIEL